MGRLAIICITWMVLSAATAYYADIWGRRLGKQRKTIGRLRPKHTAIVIITSAGALIALLSFVILLTADAGIRRALLNWDQTMVQVRGLQANLRAKQEQVTTVNQQLDAARKETLAIQAEKAVAEEQAAAAREQVADKQKELIQKQADVNQVVARLGVANAQVDQANRNIAHAKTEFEKVQTMAWKAGAASNELWKAALTLKREAQQAVNDARARLQRAQTGVIAAKKNEELARAVIPFGLSVNQARENLRRLMNSASVTVMNRSKSIGYSASKPTVAIQPRKFPRVVSGHLTSVTIGGARLLDAAASLLADKRNPNASPAGGTVVRLVAKENTLAGDTVPVDFELYANHVVFEKGQEITSLVIKSSEGKQAVMADLKNGLQAAGNAAFEGGLMVRPDESVGPIPAYQLADVYSEVQRAFREGQKSVTVRIMAARDTWTSDELTLRFEVKRYQEGA